MSSKLLAGASFLAGLAAGAGLSRLLGQQYSLDVGKDAALRDGDTGEEFVELLVVADGELQVTGDDPGLLVVTSGVARQLEHLGGEVLEHGSQVDWGARSDALSVVALAQEAVDTAHGELEPRAAGTGLALALRLAAFATSGHGGAFGLKRRRGKKQLFVLLRAALDYHHRRSYPPSSSGAEGGCEREKPREPMGRAPSAALVNTPPPNKSAARFFSGRILLP